MDNYIRIFTFTIICGLLGMGKVVGQTCKQIGVGKNNVNKRLIGFKIAEKVVPGLHECARECMFLAHCKSFNFGQDDNLCEVNHADSYSASVSSLQTVQRYIFSDISAWPRTMVGPCADQTCTGTQRCVPEKGCIDTDCDDPPEIDYAVVHPGAVTLSATRTYEFDCPPVMMKNGTNEVTCGLDFKWSPLYTRCRGDNTLLFLELHYYRRVRGAPSYEHTCGFSKKLLQNCSDVKMCNPTYSDGEYWIYPEAMGGHKIKVFCYGMTTTSPSEYITVNPTQNYAFDAGKDYSPGLFTNYEKIRVTLGANIMVDREDTTFADSTYPYASGGGCNCVVSCQPWKGYFNISTVGTGLRFGYQVTWITSGWQPGISDFTRNADSTRIWARCGGYCGGCSPDGPLYLYYNADDVVDDGNTVYPDCV